MLERYRRGDRIVTHYYNAPGEAVSLWALFEVITLGHFARFLEQLSSDALVRVAGSWGLKRKDAGLVPRLVFAVTELRNAVAHNGAVFDTRFASAKVRKEVGGLLSRGPSVRATRLRQEGCLSGDQRLRGSLGRASDSSSSSRVRPDRPLGQSGQGEADRGMDPDHVDSALPPGYALIESRCTLEGDT